MSNNELQDLNRRWTQIYADKGRQPPTTEKFKFVYIRGFLFASIRGYYLRKSASICGWF